MSADKLVYMANQIGNFFAHQGEDKAVAGVADHLEKFLGPADACCDRRAS
jgi:formate dehydrogenase subunit delta